MEKQEFSFFGREKWEEKYCVLTNVGLLYYANPLQPPQDLFPILDCDIVGVKRGQPGFTQGYESFRFVYSLREVTFRCPSKSDYDQWLKIILQLQKDSLAKRKEL